MIKPVQFSNEKKIQFPEEATKEMIDIATKVVTALVDNKFLTPDVRLYSEEERKDLTKFKKEQTNFRLQQMVNYKNNIKDKDRTWYSNGHLITEYTKLCNPHKHTSQITLVSKKIMDRFVELLGFKVIFKKVTFGNSSFDQLDLQPLEK